MDEIVTAEESDPERRPPRPSRRRVGMAAGVVVVVVVVVASVALSWPRHPSLRVAPADRSSSKATSTTSTTAPVIRAAAGPTTIPPPPAPPGIGFERTTAERLQLTATLWSGQPVPATAYWLPPASCHQPPHVDLLVADPIAVGPHPDADGDEYDAQFFVGGTESTDPIRVMVSVAPFYRGYGRLGMGEDPPSSSTIPAPAQPVLTDMVTEVTMFGSAIAHVDATFSNGTADHADAAHGMVMLAARHTRPGRGGVVVNRLDVTLTTGSVIHLAALTAQPAAFTLDGRRATADWYQPTSTTPPVVSADCTAPPPPLPAPGVQPVDPAAARNAVTATVQGALDGSATHLPNS